MSYTQTHRRQRVTDETVGFLVILSYKNRMCLDMKIECLHISRPTLTFSNECMLLCQSSLTASLQTGHYYRDDWMHPITSLSASKSPPCGINKAWFNLKRVSGSSGVWRPWVVIFISYSLLLTHFTSVYLCVDLLRCCLQLLWFILWESVQLKMSIECKTFIIKIEL